MRLWENLKDAKMREHQEKEEQMKVFAILRKLNKHSKQIVVFIVLVEYVIVTK